MLKECDFLTTCKFFEKYIIEKDTICESLILQYCRGPMKNECHRFLFTKKHKSEPDVNLMPTGQIVSF